MEITSVASEDIAMIARTVFGSHAAVDSITEIRPSSAHGILKICGCNWNLSYIVSLKDDPQAYVFRFNRRRYDRGDETLEIERRNYALIAAHTNVPTPRIYHVDVSRRLAPTGYLVMDYMRGDSYEFLTHSENPTTTQAEKDEIHRQAGHAVAQIHTISRRATSAAVGVQHVLSRLDALEHVVRNTRCRVTAQHIERCRQVVRSDPALLLDIEALSVGELYFARTNGGWAVAFTCDLEWVDYGDPYFDLVRMLYAHEPLWSLKAPLMMSHPETMGAHPFLRGYEAGRPVDYQKLAAVATYAHLCCMCSIARELYQADEGEGIETREPPIYLELLEAIERKDRTKGIGA